MRLAKTGPYLKRCFGQYFDMNIATIAGLLNSFWFVDHHAYSDNSVDPQEDKKVSVAKPAYGV